MMAIYKSDEGRDAVQRRYREILDSWPVPAEQLRIPTRAGETFVVASGPLDAPPLVLLHGSGANAGTWLGDITTWTKEFRVYAVDMLGEPGRSAPVRLPLASSEVSSWLVEVLDALDIESAAVVGMSLGGWVALDFAVRAPARVSRLALICPGGIGRQKTGWLPKAVLLGALGEKGRRRTVRMVTGLDTTGPILDDVTLIFSHFKPRTEKLPIVSDDDLRRISIPVLVTVGDRDAMFDSSETTRRAEQLIPDASVTVLPGVGHAITNYTDDVMTFSTT